MESSLQERSTSSGGALQRLASLFSSKQRNCLRSRTATPPRQRAALSQPVYYVPGVPMISADEDTQRRRSTSKRDSDSEQSARSYGLPKTLQEHYDLGKVLGHGGNATVVRAVSRRTGREFACKCLPKVLGDPTASDLKRAGHAQALQRELDAVRRLSGALNVAAFEGAYEDEQHVYIITELCRGGELWHRVGEKHYSERTVASYMRAVLRTIAQFHSHGLLHRDIKPGNFMLLSEDEASPLRAIDFGLAVPYDSEHLPRSDLGLEGTPWFMAPEVLSSAVVPASDVWSAGVMAHQLLTGRFPFDDRASPGKPAISKIWQSILVDKPDFKRSCWAGISDEAKEFVAQLLHRDPAKRPSAQQALKHAWLRGSVADRGAGKPLSLAVVQRIQRYGQASELKRSVLESIAEEMLGARAAPDQAVHGAEPDQAEAAVCRITAGATPVVTSPSDPPLQFLYRQLAFAEDGTVDRRQLSAALQRLGYKLDSAETERLLDALDSGHTGRIAKEQFAASQMDWRALQQDRDAWVARVRRAFEDIDRDEDGVASVDEIVARLTLKLPLSEVAAAVRHAMNEARKHDESVHDGLSFKQFLTMLRADSRDSLSNYDDRMSAGASVHSIGSHGASVHGGGIGSSQHGGRDSSVHGPFGSPLHGIKDASLHGKDASLHGGGSGHGSSAGGSVHSGGSLAELLDRSVRAGEVFQPIQPLDPVAEAA